MTPHNKVAIVTGAGTGIGKASAIALLKDGYRVALAGRRPEPLQQAITQAGVNAWRFQQACFALIALSVLLSLPIWGNANP